MNDYRNMPTDNEEKTDAYYSEELSRAAVGRLFDEEDEEEDGPPPIKSAFVSGFDRNPTKKRERFKKPPTEDLEDVELPPNWEDDDPREEPVADRQRRRENATTRLLHSSAPEDNYDERRERRERRRNPAPRPAVRVNVPTERQIRDTGRRPRIERDERQVRSERQERHDRNTEEHTSEDNLDNFRRRFSGELVSPPRNPNRPPRAGRSDVRTNRMRDDYRDSEVISPLRIIIVGAAILIVVLFAIITVQMLSFRSRYNEAQEAIASHEQEMNRLDTSTRTTIAGLQAERDSAEADRDEFENMLRELGHDPRQPAPPPDEDGTRPGGITETPTQTSPPDTGLPTTHTILAGESLNRIAQRYFGNQDPATVAHIQNVNGITNPNNIQAGWVLQITPMD
ncbi:MAG: LysM peptidoglycan-binding domain-containing protein [Defluviitaleaceae bacterium]|nr:LysM peptidoglycan-binding domain-containing protein [Defluviitaleaceae bacterium]